MEKIKKGFDVVNSVSIFDSVCRYAKQGALKGKYLGFEGFHKYYTMSLPGVTDWTGFPQSGKTEVLMELLLNTSVFYGWKHFVYLPDVGDATEIVADLIHKLSGKSFELNAKNRITEKDIAHQLNWVCEHFKILTKVDLKATLTPIEFWDLGIEYHKSIEGGIQTMAIDAWKDMKHNKKEYGGRDDLYLEQVLSYRNALSEKYKLHIHTIIHPIKTDKENGVRKFPGPYDLKGGTEWFNNGKCMITVDRPVGTYNDVNIHTTKIKPRSVGSRGCFKMKFDVDKLRYFTISDTEKKTYAVELKEKDLITLETKNLAKDAEKRKKYEKKSSESLMVSDIENDPDDLPF